MSSIFDVFTDTNAQKAAQDQIAAINRGITAANNYQQSGRDVLNTNTQQGLNALASGYGQGQQALNTNYAAGLQPSQTNFDVNNQGQQLLADALGVNGPEGQARAKQAFQTGPGYQWMLDQGNENILRNEARTGSPNSGATNIDLLNYGQGAANQQWQNWLQTLQPYTSAAQNSANEIGSLYGNLGNQLNQNYTGLGTQQNATYGNLGSQLMNSFNQTGQADYGAQTSMGNAQANADLAGNQASANIWNALGGAAKLGTSLFGMFSDERLKEDVEPVGVLFDGQVVHRYRYKGDPRTQIGLIAQDVEHSVPDAVRDSDIPGLRGFKMVDYHTATNRAAELMRLAA